MKRIKCGLGAVVLSLLTWNITQARASVPEQQGMAVAVDNPAPATSRPAVGFSAIVVLIAAVLVWRRKAA